ncbi:MAG: plasma-membrane proton-efflux P-type ATPase [Dehalococcoidia bacterium]
MDNNKGSKDAASTQGTASAGAGRNLKDLTVEELIGELQANIEGLSTSQVRDRISTYGYNELPEKHVSPVLKFLSYLWGPIPGMIIIAAVLSAVLQHWEDFGIIMALLLLNAVVGFREEYQASNVVAALKQKLAILARVKRDKKWTQIPSRELVPGDVIRLRIGDIIPADAKLLDGDLVQVDQAALTGESLPVERKPGETVFSGSILKQGEIDAIVYATGQNSYFGKTAELVETARTRSHLQGAVIKIADYLIAIAVILAVTIFAVSLFRGDKPLEVLQFALVLTIAAVPVAMPAVLSVTMAVGARVLALKQAIVTRLSAVEEMAGIDVLCSDKTGTLTQSKLTPGDPFTIAGITPERLFNNAALASRAENQDPIDLAILSKVNQGIQSGKYEVVHFQPFDSVHKRTEASIKTADGHEYKVTKGAPQVILALDPNAARIKEEVEKAVDGFAGRGFRSLAVASTEGTNEWHFMGVIPLSDPLRVDSRETIDAARDMGLNVKMVTGDQIAIAREVSRQLDLGNNIIDAGVFEKTHHFEGGQLGDVIEKANGFAQVYPEHKYHIVDVLQQRGHIVGMTGDGVNDAPALKKADAGIAVSGATDAARAAADLVLMVPGLSVIIDAIKESRKTFQRMTNYAIYRIAETVRVLIFMTLAILIFNFYPVTAIMIVLLAILNDGSILAIAYDNVSYARTPQRWNMKEVLILATALGIIGVVASFALFYIGEKVFHLSLDTIQTFMYLKLSVAGQLTIFLARTRGPFWSSRPSNLLLLAAAVAQIIATIIAVFGILMAPLGWAMAAFIWGYAIVWFIITDRIKLLIYRILDKHRIGTAAQKGIAG